MSTPPRSPPKKKHTTAAKTQFPDIPEDIILCDILPRLPAKTLVRFKSVSREWKALISSTQFAKTHLTHLPSLSSRSVLTLDYQWSFDSLDYGKFPDLNFTYFGDNFTDTTPFLVDSCNGLAFLICSSEGCEKGTLQLPDHLLFFKFHFVVYNPVLGLDAFIEIQHPDQFLLSTNKFSTRDYNFGFGYVSSHDDYYIVAINFPKIVAFVYSLKTREWKRKEIPRIYKKYEDLLEFQDPWYLRIGILVKETLHWGITVGEDLKCIAVFDLASQKEFTNMELPYADFGEDGHSVFSLCCLDDCLCAWANYDNEQVREMWMLKEYGVHESWTKLFRLNQADICRNYFGFTDSGLTLIYAFTDELMLADFRLDPPTYLHTGSKGHFNVVNYVQSLVSPLALSSDQRE